LDRELAVVPPDLAERIHAAVRGEARAAPVADGARILTDAAARELRSLLDRGCETRWAAPGLLTVDALVTYACELLARSGADMCEGTANMVNTIIKVLPAAGPIT
jgi:hypothetical protein